MRFRSELIHLDLLLKFSALTSLAAAQQLSSRGRTFKVGDAKSAEDILESVHDVVTDYHRQADHKLPEERNADVGVLAKAKKKKCTKGFVNCVNGFVKGSGNAITCKDACSGSCCVGNSAFPDACEKFTGQICKDQSCSGKKACTNASIKSVVNSCRGSSACYKVAVPCPSPTYSYGCKDYNAVTGRVGPVVNSCTGDEACALAGSADGRIGSIQDSCNGKSACYAAGGLGGRVQSIRNSCNDDRACLLIGRRGQVGSIQNSCGGYTACRFLGDDGYVGSIKDSCFGYGACAETGAFDNDIGGVESIKDSCKGDSSCAHTATNGGSIGSIRDSCIDSGACFGAGGFGGNVLSIVGSCIGIASCSGLGIGVGGGTGKLVQSCNGASACSSAGAADGYTGAGDQSGVDFGFGVLDTVGTGPIDSNMRGCCNGPELCDGVNEVTLPVNCK